MKHKALFKSEKKRIKVSSAAVLFGSLRVKEIVNRGFVKSSSAHKIKVCLYFLLTKARSFILYFILLLLFYFFFFFLRGGGGAKSESVFVYNRFETLMSCLLRAS